MILSIGMRGGIEQFSVVVLPLGMPLIASANERRVKAELHGIRDSAGLRVFAICYRGLNRWQRDGFRIIRHPACTKTLIVTRHRRLPSD